MATETESSDSTTEPAEMAETETEGTNEAADETSDQAEDDAQSEKTDDANAAAAKRALLADLHKERREAKAAKARVAELEAQVAELAPAKETADAVQTRYDRLEAFLLAVGGPVSEALDSRSLTTKLFETDDDISSIVKDWQKANPSATTQALGSKTTPVHALNSDGLESALKTALGI